MGLYAWLDQKCPLTKEIAHRFKGGYLQLFQCLIQFVGDKKFTEINTVTHERMSEVLVSGFPVSRYPVSCILIQETQKQMDLRQMDGPLLKFLLLPNGIDSLTVS